MCPASKPDPIFASWLEYELSRAFELARNSDLLEFVELDEHHFIARFGSRGLVREPGGPRTEHDHFEIGIQLGDDYLRSVRNPLQVVQLLTPRHTYHPNVRGRVICVGPIHPGSSLVSLLHRCHEILTYQEYATLEHDALNIECCQWTRNHVDRFPIDDRPIQRRTRPVALDRLQVTP